MKDIIMTREDKEDFVNNNICQFCEKEIIDKKDKDHCHLTGKYRGPARIKCKIIVKQTQNIFLVLYYIKLVFMIVISFSKT